MALLKRQTIQKLAVLHALSLWRRGAYGQLRLQKTLFFADKDSKDQEWRLFTFKRWYLGQYSDDVSGVLNLLQSAGRIKIHFDGPCERIEADIPPKLKPKISRIFKDYFREWDRALGDTFQKWAYLKIDQILARSHDDPTYKQSEHGQVIAKSCLADEIDLIDLDEKTAETLSDLVDPFLSMSIRSRLRKAVKKVAIGENWKSIYFPDDRVAS